MLTTEKIEEIGNIIELLECYVSLHPQTQHLCISKSFSGVMCTHKKYFGDKQNYTQKILCIYDITSDKLELLFLSKIYCNSVLLHINGRDCKLFDIYFAIV